MAPYLEGKSDIFARRHKGNIYMNADHDIRAVSEFSRILNIWR